jgi:hypothetical protein
MNDLLGQPHETSGERVLSPEAKAFIQHADATYDQIDNVADMVIKALNQKESENYSKSVGYQLAEKITGLSPEDPKMKERLIEDQKIIRQKVCHLEICVLTTPLRLSFN